MQNTENNIPAFDLREERILSLAKTVNKTENLSDEQIEETRRAMYIMAMALKESSLTGSSYEKVKGRMGRVYDGLPEAFRINIKEYINDKPLSPVTHRNWTLEKIIQANEAQNISFFEAAKLMGEFIRLGDRAADNFCAHYNWGKYDAWK